jgi:recombination protein RecT
MLNQIVKIPEKIMTVFEDSVAVKEFESILHGGANSFVKSALIAISASPDLMACTPNSLVIGTLRSATLGLSLDPALRQAYLVPRKGQACFQPHYSGLYDLAVRTNKYKYISVAPIHHGETVWENPLTGIHYYQLEGRDTLMAPNPGQNGLHTDNMRDVTNGKNTNPIIGYLGYFRTMQGFEKSVWMTRKEIQAHAQLWSPASYSSEKGAWQDAKKRPIMEMKTVFIALSKFMDLSGSDNSKLREAIEDVTVLDEEPITVIATQDEDYPAELIVESVQPAPVKPAVKLVVNETITDSEWERFGKLLQSAHNAGLVVTEYNRASMTAEKLNGVTNYIRQEMAKK